MSGRKRRLPGTIEPSKEKRHCGADGCNDQLVGTSFAYHYRSRTDFDKLKVLRNLPRQLAEEELKTTDSHTAYMFRHNHSATNLPHWRAHKPVAKAIPSICLLTSWVSTINWIGQKGHLQFIGFLGHYFTPVGWFFHQCALHIPFIWQNPGTIPCTGCLLLLGPLKVLNLN